MQLRRSQKIFKTVKPSTIERMTPPSLNGDVSLFLCIGVNHLEGDVRSSRSMWLTPLQDTRSKSVEIGKIFTDLDPLPTCLLYTSDDADDMQCVDLGGRLVILYIIIMLTI